MKRRDYKISLLGLGRHHLKNNQQLCGLPLALIGTLLKGNTQGTTVFTNTSCYETFVLWSPDVLV